MQGTAGIQYTLLLCIIIRVYRYLYTWRKSSVGQYNIIIAGIMYGRRGHNIIIIIIIICNLTKITARILSSLAIKFEFITRPIL